MPAYTLTVTFAPVSGDDDWSRLYNLLDVVPGAHLIEDPEAPTAMMVVDAGSQSDAFKFADGVFKVLGLDPRTGSLEMFEPVAGLDELLGDDTQEQSSAPTGETKSWRKALATC